MRDKTSDGPPNLFVLGVRATGGTWCPVVDTLETRSHSVNVQMPFGAHQHPSTRVVDHSRPADT